LNKTERQRDNDCGSSANKNAPLRYENAEIIQRLVELVKSDGSGADAIYYCRGCRERLELRREHTG